MSARAGDLRSAPSMILARTHFLPSVFRWTVAAGVGVSVLLLGACATSYPQPRELTFAPSREVDLDAMVESPSGLFYRDITVGMGEEAGRGDRVQLHYIGAFIDGTVFERSTDLGPPIEFRLGAREVIRGWDEGIRGMREGGLRQLVIPPQLAYGSGDREAGIPAGATLVFQIQLVKVGGS